MADTTTAPVTLEDAKRQLQQGGETLDADRQAEIAGFLADAISWVEQRTGHIFIARDVTEEFIGFGDLRLRAWPIKAGVVPVVTYADPMGGSVPVTGVRTRVSARPARVTIWSGYRWPAVVDGTAVFVTVRAGYEPGEPIPGDLRRAVLILVGAYDADREGGELLALAIDRAKQLCADYRFRRL